MDNRFGLSSTNRESRLVYHARRIWKIERSGAGRYREYREWGQKHVFWTRKAADEFARSGVKPGHVRAERVYPSHAQVELYQNAVRCYYLIRDNSDPSWQGWDWYDASTGRYCGHVDTLRQARNIAGATLSRTLPRSRWRDWSKWDGPVANLTEDDLGSGGRWSLYWHEQESQPEYDDDE